MSDNITRAYVQLKTALDYLTVHGDDLGQHATAHLRVAIAYLELEQLEQPTTPQPVEKPKAGNRKPRRQYDDTTDLEAISNALRNMRAHTLTNRTSASMVRLLGLNMGARRFSNLVFAHIGELEQAAMCTIVCMKDASDSYRWAIKKTGWNVESVES